VTIATNLGVPRSTARSWRGKAPKIVVSMDVLDLSASELQREILQLRRRVRKLTALLRLALALRRSSGFTLAHERLPDACGKIRILRAVNRVRVYVPLRALLRFLRVSPSRFYTWRGLKYACALDDRSSCPHTSPHRLTLSEVRAIEDMVTAPAYRHVPTGTLAVLAQRLGTVWASPSTWYRLVRQNGWRRPRLRVHPAKPPVGSRTTPADEMSHIDATVTRLLDGTRIYLHAVIDFLATDLGVRFSSLRLKNDSLVISDKSSERSAYATCSLGCSPRPRHRRRVSMQDCPGQEDSERGSSASRPTGKQRASFRPSR